MSEFQSDSDFILQSIRSKFPYFSENEGDRPIFFENAGGSQLPSFVIDSIHAYMVNSYCQLGAGYNLSNRADTTISNARVILKAIFNSYEIGEVIIGSSTSQLLSNISQCYAASNTIKPGNVIVLQDCSHEANIGPWLRLAEATGATIKWWRMNLETLSFEFDDLRILLNEETKIVAVTHVSNLLGEILDVKGVVSMVTERTGEFPAKVVVDGVAYAPHLAIDVADWGVDWLMQIYVF